MADLRSRLSRLIGGTLRGGDRLRLDAVSERFERRVRALANAPAATEGGDRSDAIVVQGPATADTETSLASLRRLYPREKIVLSTWRDIDAALQARLAGYCDAVVVSAPPQLRGGSNRNYQIVSTNAGIARARELGARTVIKMRTDTCLMSPHLFALYRLCGAQYERDVARASGLAGRILVPQTYTKKYFPFHVSDIVMLGDAGDLARYWNVPLDDRALAPEDFSWGRQSLERIGIEGLLPECYLGWHFADGLGLADRSDPLSAYWRLLRDHFVVVDDAWFDLYWLKRPLHLQPRAVDELVTHHFWQALYFGLDVPLAAWRADLDAARTEGASFDYGSPPKLAGCAAHSP
jgi:WavE lipopolysaccharide synthesis